MVGLPDDCLGLIVVLLGVSYFGLLPLVFIGLVASIGFFCLLLVVWFIFAYFVGCFIAFRFVLF